MLMAILGRGIQRVDEYWDVTEDLEVCALDRSHLQDRVPADDRNPNCLVGGGELNLLAGMELHRRIGATVAVCAYSHRAKYLVGASGPSESEVMSVRLSQDMHDRGMRLPEVCVWDKDRVGKGTSNTHRELMNILLLAFERSLRRVFVVTLSVHAPRATLFVRSILEKNRNLAHIEVSFVSSEQVLVEACPSKYAPRVLALYGSQAYSRTAFYEHRGSVAFLEDRY